MKKQKLEIPIFEYPPELRYAGGCKVAWLYYGTREEAMAAADVARAEASYKRERGYDFGYCSPGDIVEVNGEFKVTIP